MGLRVNTPMGPNSGQGVECHISPDGRWLLYNETWEDVERVYAVEVGFYPCPALCARFLISSAVNARPYSFTSSSSPVKNAAWPAS
jgi:hypothetical protein